ncbi:MFS transporter [Micromonospora sp. NBC_01412]|uniref:MFS transporter n=1 Tax=Micromonospora sp. NBC_01412 TaxID=2903590 RepID=UPI0032478B6A
MDMFRTLRHRPFRLLWTSALLIQLAHWLAVVAFQWEVANRTNNNALLLGILYFFTTAPFLLFSLPAGVLADTRDRRRLLLAVLCCAVVLDSLCILLAGLDAMPTIMVTALGFLAGCVVTVVSPTNQALIAGTVATADLASAIPLQAAGLNLARILGPAVAGPLLMLAGSTLAFTVCCLAAIAAVLLAWRLPAPPRPAFPPVRARMHRQVLAGIAHVRQRPPAAMALAITAITSIFGSSYQAQLPVVGARISDDGNTAFLVLATLGGIGSLFGIFSVARRRGRMSLPAAAKQLTALGIVVALVGMTTSAPLVALLIIAAGGLTLSIMTSISSLLQQVIDDTQRGRVMSLYILCWGGLLPFGGLAMGVLSQATDPGWSFAIFGGVTAVAGLASTFRTGPGRTRLG